MHAIFAILMALVVTLFLLVVRRFVSTGQFIAALFMWGVPMCLLSSCEVLGRATTTVSGTVLASDTSCVQPANNRCSTKYRVRPDPGAGVTAYTAGPSDRFLQRRLPVGTHIRKERWALVYFVNEQAVDDFPVVFYATIFSLGVGMVAFGSLHAPAAYRRWLADYSKRAAEPRP